jgi:hypothetical protein
MSLTLAAVALFVATVGAGTPKEYTFRTIDIPGADATFAMGINASGDIVGFYLAAGVRHGFTLSRGVVQTVDGPDALTVGTMLFGISPSGTVTGFSNTTEPCGENCPAFIPLKFYGFAWRAGSFDILQVPGNLYTTANRVNACGDIVGETMDPSGKAYGFLRRGETMTMLDMSEDAALEAPLRPGPVVLRAVPHHPERGRAPRRVVRRVRALAPLQCAPWPRPRRPATGWSSGCRHRRARAPRGVGRNPGRVRSPAGNEVLPRCTRHPAVRSRDASPRRYAW